MIKKEWLLSNVLEGIRNDLIESAAGRTEDWSPVFAIEDLEVELYVDFSNEIVAGGGVKAYVVNFLGRYAGKKTSGHKVKLKLKPLGSLTADHCKVSVKGTKDPILRGGKPAGKAKRRNRGSR